MLNFVQLASDHRIPCIDSGHHHCHRGWVQTHCPRCTGGREGFHLGFSLVAGTFNCWRCGSLPRLEVVQGLLRISRGKAIELLKRYEVKGQKVQAKKQGKARRKSAPKPPGTGSLGSSHLRYLKSRRFGQEVIETWELMGAGYRGGIWSWRVIYPVKNVRGEVVAWQGRSILPEGKPKYRLSEDEDCLEDPHGFLYGIHLVPGESVIVVEGAADVWRIGPGAVATFGIDWKVEQANQLRSYQNRYIMYDPEEKAQEKAQELASWLAMYPGRTEVIDGLPSDPGDLPQQDVREIRRELLGKTNGIRHTS